MARLPDYIEDLKQKANLVRATDGIAGLGAEAEVAVPFLIPLIRSDDFNARHNAIYALGRIGPGASSALPVLRDVLPELEGGTKTEALNSIRLISEGKE